MMCERQSDIYFWPAWFWLIFLFFSFIIRVVDQLIVTLAQVSWAHIVGAMIRACLFEKRNKSCCCERLSNKKLNCWLDEVDYFISSITQTKKLSLLVEGMRNNNAIRETPTESHASRGTSEHFLAQFQLHDRVDCARNVSMESRTGALHFAKKSPMSIYLQVLLWNVVRRNQLIDQSVQSYAQIR